MSEGHCGHCDYHYGVKRQKIECLVDSKWYESDHSCEYFKEYVSGKTEERRLTEAIEVRRSREAKTAEQRDREFAEREAEKDRIHAKELLEMRMKFDKKLRRASWWWQLILVVIGAGLGILGTLLVV